MDDLFGSSSPVPRKPDEPVPRPPGKVPPRAAPPLHLSVPPRTFAAELARLARFLYCHNPFYCISAFLVLWGLGRSFHMQGALPRPELLMSGLIAYALLLAAVACLLIRAGQLWEDIRTILLLIVLIFLAISMSFDEVLSTNQALGRAYFLGGLAFAVVLSELVLRGARLRLPTLYRLPYYATLALFFLYPLLLGPWQKDENVPQLRWLLAGFSPAAGLIALTLLPAIRRGPAYVRDNGSPWQWPWFPWPLYVMLSVGVALRTYALCISFHPSHGPATMFEPYFFVPFLFAVNILLLEIGIGSRRHGLLTWTMAAPLGLLLLSAWTLNVPPEINLRPMLAETLGCTPLFLTLAVVTLFYAVAWARRVPHAFHWLTAAVALFVVVGPKTLDLQGPYMLRAWPLALLATGQLYPAVRRRSGLHSLLAAGCAIAAACVVWPQELVLHWNGAIPAHVMLAIMLLIGGMLCDRAALFLQRVAVAAIAVACVYVISGEAGRCGWASPAVLALYTAGMLLTAAAYGIWLQKRWYWGASLILLTGWAIGLSGRGYRSLRTTVVGLDQIALGLAFLLAGLLVSLWKLGIPQAWMQRLFRSARPPTAPVMPVLTDPTDDRRELP